jgi:hypothetical protein
MLTRPNAHGGAELLAKSPGPTYRSRERNEDAGQTGGIERTQLRAGWVPPASLEASGQNRLRISPAIGRWQVFGLASAPAGPASYCPPLPGLEWPVQVVELVLAYRCGAAPDSNRVPYWPGHTPEHQHGAEHIATLGRLSTAMARASDQKPDA